MKIRLDLILLLVYLFTFLLANNLIAAPYCSGTVESCSLITSEYRCDYIGGVCSSDLDCDGYDCSWYRYLCDGISSCGCLYLPTRSECNYSTVCKDGDTQWTYNCTCVGDWNCTTTCDYNGGWVPDGCGSNVWCPATEDCCPAAGTCTTNCGANASVPDGACGTTSCACTECEDCDPACGQTKSCGGNCGTGANGIPPVPTIISPPTAIGTTIGCSANVNLKWNSVGGSINDGYNFRLSLDTSSIKNGDVIVPTTEVLVNPTGIGKSGVQYNWDVRSFNATCSTFLHIGGTEFSAYSNKGYFCRECEDCSPECGQARCGGSCPIDEALTDCSPTLSTQYIETPQTTGTVWVRATGCGSEVKTLEFPTWNTYGTPVEDDIVWYNALKEGGGTTWQSSINVASHQPLLGNPVNTHTYVTGCNHTSPNPKKRIVGATSSFRVVAKTCAVTINTPGAVSSQTDGINITTTGNAHINPGEDTVRSFVSKEDNPAIVGGVTYDYGGSFDISTTKDVNNFYYFDNVTKTSTNSINTSANYVVHAPPGTYRVHCDVPSDLNEDDDLVKCSGNPNCSFNLSGGSVDCASIGWKSCSSNDWATFRINSPPTFTSLIIKNADSGVVTGESGGTTLRNHICQTTFQNTINPPRRVIFEANVNDPDGGTDISTAILTWNGKPYTMTKVSSSGTGAIMRAPVDFLAGDNAIGVYDLFVTVTDIYGVTTGPVNTNRDWKVWNCQVPTSGTLYNGSAGQSCPVTGFSVPIDGVVGFNSIYFSDTPDVTMTYKDLNSYGTNNIVWGKTYHPRINGGTAGNEDGTLLATGRVTRIVDLGVGTTTCPLSSSFTIDNNIVSAYSANPEAQIDFSFVEDQEAWYQVEGAGVKGREEVESGVPITALQKALTWSGIDNVNGLVSSGDLLPNINGCDDFFNDCKWGSPNNWYLEQNTNDSDIYNYKYKYFYENFFVKAGVGVTGMNWFGRPTKGIYFVKNSLTIDINFLLTSPNTETMMVIVNGDINIASNVTNLDGIYIANGSIIAGGDNTNPLIINGMLYAGGSVRLNRSFANKTDNNDNPAVKVNYSPGLIFNLDPRVLRVLSGWREE